MDSSSDLPRHSLFERFFRYLDKHSPGDRLLFTVALTVFLATSLAFGLQLGEATATPTPANGGAITEGVVGTPRFINPILAFTRADKDLTALVYRGLMKIAPNGDLVPDLAESVTVSDDGLTYNVVLKSNIRFHDNTSIRAEDVAFTIQLTQEPTFKSPRRGDWNGVSTEVVSDTELNIVLREAHPPFIENLTLGIMPKAHWDNLSSEQFQFSQNNTKPIGSGHYKIDTVVHNDAGLIDSYRLSAFRGSDSAPKIETVRIQFFDNYADSFAAYHAGTIDAVALTSNTLPVSDMQLPAAPAVVTPLPIVFDVFFNQNKSTILRDDSVRQALFASVDREDLVKTHFSGTAFPTPIPVPSGFFTNQLDAAGTTTASSTDAATLMREGGWERSESGVWSKIIDGATTTAAFTISTENRADYLAIAEYLQKTWERIGFAVTINGFGRNDIEFSVISPRNYEALLYGVNLERHLDLYSFWHSSQKDDPGRNVALYTNITTDALLRKMRQASSTEVKQELMGEFFTELQKERPSVPLFSPGLIYLAREHIALPNMTRIEDVSQRYENIHEWYTEKQALWPLFME